jgi:predicted Zn-dependent peptidase
VSVETPRDEPTRQTLDNGVRVVTLRRAWGSAVAVNLWYDVGSRHDPAGRSGFAHLFEHLMFQGTARIAPGEHIAAIHAVGGVTNASTAFDRTNYWETLPAAQLDLALWLEAERLNDASLTQVGLDTQREVVKNERRQRYDDVPYGLSSERLHAAAFPAGHPYHHTTIGRIEHLDAATLDDARAFFAAGYRPSRLVVTVAGAVDPSHAAERVAHWFGAIREPGVPSFAAPEPPPAWNAGACIEMDGDVPAPAVHVLLPMPPDADAGCDAAELLARVLGGPGGRLHDRLVRRRAIATFASAGLTRLAVGASTLAVTVRGAGGGDPDRLWQALTEELVELAAGGPDVAELRAARRRTTLALAQRLGHLSGLADELSRYELGFGDAGLALTATARFDAVTDEAVAEVARGVSPERAVRLMTRSVSERAA